MLFLYVSIVLFLVWVINAKVARRPAQKEAIRKKAIGQKVVIRYFDQNSYFESIFPKTGVITQVIKVGQRDMFVVELDEAFSYNNREHKAIVIAERHVGYYIGKNEEVHVHVLLPLTDLTCDKYSLNDFDHVVWAIINPISQP